MTTILNYTNCEQIFESDNSIVYRGVREADNLPVILKVLKEDYPSPEKLAHYRQEYDITRRLENIEGVINTYGLEKYQNTLVIILEDFGGKSLEKMLAPSLLERGRGCVEAHTLLENDQGGVEEFLSIALKITEILGEIHAANVIHKDINPSNLVYNSETKQLKIIDFGISTELPRENTTLKNPNQLEGTLAYLSPEQTGRMNRALDYRTDFYALGVTFYRLLTAHLPFEAAKDDMELLHCHLAKPPKRPDEFNLDMPEVISGIIIKLLAKTAEDRYQSASGLKTDLAKCEVALRDKGQIERFRLGQQDCSYQLQLSQKLYGREQQIGTLREAFDRISQGQREMMLVTGYSGIGKTSLVQEIYQPMTEKRGYFISGKFDQLQRNIPYTAVVTAFTDLVRQLLTERDTQLTEWKAKILKAVGQNGQVIIEVIPEVELIIGEQPEVPELSAAESQNRFKFVFQNFIKVFTQPEHPLVIFLDDLQWADSGSLKLMQLLMESADIQALFLIGAYRDNEVNETHPLRQTITEIQQAKAVVNQISLSDLELPHVGQLIADALHCSLETAHSLAELVCQKTEGNPFFINQFLKSLSDEKLLTFDVERGRWQWDLEQIRARGFTDNVVELMVGKIQQLSDDTQKALRVAACFGNQFELTTLATVLEKNSEQTAADLRDALINGQLLPTKKSPPTEIDLKTDNWSLITEYKFAHDRIQEAAYSLIPDIEKPTRHRQIGQLLLKNTPKEEREQKIFAIVDQLNMGIALIEQQRDELAELNLIAGKKAKMSAAYQPAYDYLKRGLELLGEDSWQTQYDLTLALHEEAAEAAYINDDFDQMEQWIEIVLQQAKTVLDKVKIYEVKIQAHQALNQLNEALNTGLHVLELLGVKFPKFPNKWHVLLALLKTKWVLIGKRIGNIINLSEMTDSNQQAAMRIIASAAVYAYMTAPELFVLFTLKVVNLSLKQGNAPESAFGYSGYAAILCGRLGDIETGYQFGELALNVLHQSNVRKYQAKTRFIVYALVKHWKNHINESITPLRETYQSGLDTGDLEFVGYAVNSCFFSYLTGQKLSGLEQKMCLWRKNISQFKQETALNYPKIFHQTLLNLMDRSKNPYQLIGEAYNEQTMLPLSKEANDRTILFWFYYNKLILCYLLESYSEAIGNATEAENNLDAITGFPHVPIFHFYDSLTQLALYKTATKQEQRQYRKKVIANQKKMKKWAHHAPMNYLHKFYLVEAEWHHRVLGKDCKAMDLYDQAIAKANENEYLNDEALAYELAAKFYMAKRKHKIAQVYFRDAHHAYTHWGALAKVKHLEEHYPEYFFELKPIPNPNHTAPLSDKGTRKISDLDSNSVLKASQIIASEMKPRQLLEQLLKNVLENAGAQRGFLLLEKEGEWFIEAEGTIDEMTVLQSIPLSQLSITSYSITSYSLPTTLIDYVTRTKESVVLEDAAQQGAFTHDPHIDQHQTKSVLCLPLLSDDNKLTCLLYLENNQTTGVFTPNRLEVLKLLSLPIATSIKNARTYQQLLDQNLALMKRIAELENN
ncbi:MAG: serine/threonine-protein kinase PknK [Candidatus Parabeggiatoa sp. nov. 2]|nr:MAG: hypothetical protein B6247_27885 [Beggiatoa sp. 4572_84]RKZ56814.1 MAG: serine/threonine-protein kinase PknK [Gammaproteobacteria bacterium]